ncbi:hypothetical protein SGLAM104S_09359 [Streptomyces glaucescens]
MRRGRPRPVRGRAESDGSAEVGGEGGVGAGGGAVDAAAVRQVIRTPSWSTAAAHLSTVWYSRAWIAVTDSPLSGAGNANRRSPAKP